MPTAVHKDVRISVCVIPNHDPKEPHNTLPAAKGPKKTSMNTDITRPRTQDGTMESIAVLYVEISTSQAIPL
jgi:hypothetical protein